MYKLFESGVVDEWEFYIAQKLGMTVAEMCARMDNREYEMWKIYLGRRAQKVELAVKAAKNNPM